jgi:hypothetical protein
LELVTADGHLVTQQQAVEYARRVYQRTHDPRLYGHVHIFDPSYGVNSVATKRWSSAYHGIPSMSESKQAFVSRFEGGLFGKCDFSQHELRIIAALCKDPNMMQAFIDNKDLHRMVASKMYHVPEEDVTPNQRSVAKCLHGDVLVQTEDGPVTIRDLYDNNTCTRVYSYGKSGLELKPVVNHFQDRSETRMAVIRARNPRTGVVVEIKSTVDHKFYLADGTMAEAQMLSPGAKLMGSK